MNKDNLILLLISFVTLLIGTGCYEPTEIDGFDDGENIVVIEGKITNIDSVSTVSVTSSVGIGDTVNCKFVDNAIVYLKDDSGNSALLDYCGNGIYQTHDIVGNAGSRYLLTVEVDGARFNSVEKMPAIANVDSIIVEYQDNRTYFDTIGYYMTVCITDDIDTIRYYRIEVECNGQRLDGYGDMWLYETPRKSSQSQLPVPRNFSIGDSVVVNVYALSATVYEYFIGLSRHFKMDFSNIQPPLTNPDSNIKTDAMGYFQASAVYRTALTISNEPRAVFRMPTNAPASTEIHQ